MIQPDEITELDLSVSKYRLRTPAGNCVIYPNVRKIYIPQNFDIEQYNNLDNLMFPNLEEIVIDPQNKVLKSNGPLLYAYDKLRFVFSAGNQDTLTLPEEPITEIGYQALKHTRCSHIICNSPTINLHPSALEDAFWTKTDKEFFILNDILYRAKYTGNTLYIPDGIEHIYDRAFDLFPDHSLIHTINAPIPLSYMSNNISHILKHPAFHIKKYIIRSAPNINMDTLYLMSELQHIEVLDQENTSNYKSVNGILYTKDLSALVAYPCAKKQRIIQLPEGTQHIQCEAFMSPINKKIKLILPRSLKTISEHAFIGTNVTDLTVHYNPEIDLFEMLNTLPRNLHVVNQDGTTTHYEFKSRTRNLWEKISQLWNTKQFTQDNIAYEKFNILSNRDTKMEIAQKRCCLPNAHPGYLEYLKKNALAFCCDMLKANNSEGIVTFLNTYAQYISTNTLLKLFKSSQTQENATVTAYLLSHLHQRVPAPEPSLKL